MQVSKGFLSLLLSSFVAASPIVSLDERATEFCHRDDRLKIGTYTVYNNLFSKDPNDHSSGPQCTTVYSESGGTVSWGTKWTWGEPSNQVKSYSHAAVDVTSKKISQYSSLQTSWKWSLTGTKLVADVAYDLFTSSSAGGKSQFEVMVWLVALGGAFPTTSTGSPISSPTINGVSFNLYKGAFSGTTVFSFVAKNSTPNFSGDILDFMDFLVDNHGFDRNQYITSIGAGTEAFSGSNAVFTSTYKIVVV